MLKLRLKKFGKKQEASYRIVASDSKKRRDGRPVEELGFYNPRTDETRLNEPAIINRLEQGAQPTKTVRSILEKADILRPVGSNNNVTNPPKLVPSRFRQSTTKSNNKPRGSSLPTPKKVNVQSGDVPLKSKAKTKNNQSNHKYLEPKYINIWTTKTTGELVKQLKVNVSYNMNFMIGKPVKNRLTIDASSEIIDPSALDNDGLRTDWVVSSSTIKLETLKDKPSISIISLPLAEHSVEIAQFSLFIPTQDDSKTIKLLITPLVSKDMSMDILIYARGELFRQLTIELDADEISESSEVTEPSVLTIEC